jgi:hypothetical protein
MIGKVRMRSRCSGTRDGDAVPNTQDKVSKIPYPEYWQFI